MNNRLVGKEDLDRMQILTENGFRQCDGIEKTSHARVVTIVFDDSTEISGSHDHMILRGDEWFPLGLLEIDDEVDGKIVIDVFESDSEDLYDAINVEESHSYLTNGIISHNCIYLDEFAFINNAEEFYQSTYPVVTSGKTTKVIITSTPNGQGNLFHKLWESAVQGVSDFKPFRVYWYDVPGRDENFKKKTIGETSEKQWRQEFDCLGKNSQIQILINKIKYTIRIGDLYEAIESSNLFGVSTEEEVRRFAIRWDHA